MIAVQKTATGISWRRVGDDPILANGEVLIADTPGPDWIWPDGELVPRSPTAEESAAAALAPARAQMVVSALQARLALSQAGMRAAFEAWGAAPERTQDELDYMRYAQTWQRLSPVVAAGAAALGISDEQLDGLFGLAATL